MERDAYKQALAAYKNSLDTIEWAIGIIGTLVLALMGYALFKDKKEYENALKGAEKACEKAEQWEEKARSTCDKIDMLVKDKLAEIENLSKQKTKTVLDEIDKKVEVKLKAIEAGTRKSTHEIDATTKKQMEITGRWLNAVRSYKEGKIKGDEKLLENACQKFEQVIKIKPDSSDAYSSWGAALAELGKIKGDEKFFEQACQKIEQAIKIEPDSDTYSNWGAALIELGKIKGDEKFFEQAYQKFEQAIKIEPDKSNIYSNWSVCFLEWAKLKIGSPEYRDLLKQAEEKSLKAESLQTGSAAYNLSCVYALRDDNEQCKKWLLIGQKAGTLVTRNFAMKDSDLASIRDEPWFKEIKWKGEK